MISTKFKSKTCLVNMEENIIYSNSVTEHIRNDDEILTVVAKASVTSKVKKCALFGGKVQYFRHLILASKLEVDNVHNASWI